MKNGYVKLYRSILDKPYSNKPDYVWVWCYLLLRATFKEREVMIGNKKILLKPGQLITGRKKLAEQTGVNKIKIYRILKCYENEHQIEQQKTNKYTVITIKNWHKHQANEQQNEQHLNNKRTTDEQQMNTYNKDKKEKKDNNIIGQVISYLNLKANKNFRSDGKIAVKNITARLNEKYILEQFKKVVDIKCSHWLELKNGKLVGVIVTDEKGREQDMSIYLSPDTLFGTKFEKYLNQNANKEAIQEAVKHEKDWQKIKEVRPEETYEYKPIPEEANKIIIKAIPTYRDKKGKEYK